MKHVLKTTLVLVFCLGFLSCVAKTKNDEKVLAELKQIDPPKKQHIKVALLLDTSNSMDGLIDQAKAQLWQIVNELSYAKCGNEKPNLKIALYEYGNDNLNDKEGYIRQVLGFSSDLDEISKELFSLTTNGGNEFCGYVIQTSLNQLGWGTNESDLKLIFIAGNEPFTQGSVSYQDASENASKKDIVVNTIFCGDYNQGISSFWKDGADIAGGNYMAINHNKATIHIASPYDDTILQLNIALNKTYIAYGNTGKNKVALQQEQDTNAEEYSTANAVSRTVSKSSHLYNNSKWDLVDASNEKDFDFESVKKEQLPDELKNKSLAEIKAFVSRKKGERLDIQKQIQELNTKRKAFLKTQSKVDNELGDALISAIKSQAKKKNYYW
ncbi:VWA domain-containing protein [Ichthyenterobacterium sp. W332]|uniref:VWA domain-containing protein n=1 Tax=Microcosmobacter mediterraneus TaxID=3075607 RepID=A0ABU2YNQ5_9FLAO|nr:VWA domain-containing protein [Ichthyenterobacterium sp. W332]MDT0558895.1 VWA domain-containing protein [Ichthyenterobacterium sp. W332]